MSAPLIPAYPLTRLRRAFDRRAATLDGVRFLLDEVAARMHERLAVIRLAPRRMLDAGCGTGTGEAVMRARFPDAHWLGLDLSAAMLGRAAASRKGSGLARLVRRICGAVEPVQFIQGDLAALPLAGGSVDLLWSNLALHWVAEPHKVFPEWRRALADEGVLMFSMFGPDTLRQLRTALAKVDGEQHVPTFVDMHDLGDMLVHCRFATPVMDMELLTVTYETPQALLADVRRLGFNPAATAAPGLKSRAWRERLHAALDAQRNADGVIPLSFEIVFGHAWKPAPGAARTDRSPEGHALISLDRIGRRRQTR